MTRFIALFALAVSAAVVGPLARGVVAQEGTPVVFPITPDPAECRVEPRPIAFFEQFVGTPVPGSADEAEAEAADAGATPQAFVPPTGTPADAETVAAATSLAVELVACFNAGDYPRAFAFYTDAYFAGLWAEVPLPQEELDFYAAPPEPLPIEQRNVILAIRDVIELPDGRIGAWVEFHFDDGRREAEYVLLVRDGDRILVDEIVYAAPLEATPTP